MYHFIWRDRETGLEFSKSYDHERDAVNAWCAASRYVNTEPLAMTPAPDWDAYSHDGKTPCGNRPN